MQAIGRGGEGPARRRIAMLQVACGARSLGWMSRGACRQADPELFFPISVTAPGAQQAEAAKTVCGGCSVRANCLSYALEAMPEGIWGGTTPEERRAVRRSSSRRSRGTAAAAATGQSAAQAGHAAGQRATPSGRTA
jgi:WhiB family transcriptional regulator, redox-sensing transcriptional regulator